MVGLLLIILSAIIFPGIILRAKSLAAGRKGPGIFQPIKDIYLLLRKGNVFSTTTSFIFQVAPAITLAAIISAALVIPFGKHDALISFSGDFLFFAYIMAFGKFFTIIGALDTGSSFEGMGANREALYSMLVEPAFFIIIAAFSMFTGYTSFEQIFAHIEFSNYYSYVLGLLTLYIIIQVTMVENSRVPVDDPKTHLELTMIHEVMVLDNSGFDMALINIGKAIKFAIYGALIANCIIPNNWPLWAQAGLFVAVQSGIAFTIGLLESYKARYKMMKNPQFMLTLSAIALLVFTLVLFVTEKIN